MWEAAGGLELPFSARNLKTMSSWATLVKPGDLLATTMRLEKDRFRTPPAGPGATRRLAPVPDKVQTYGLNLAPVLPEGR